jgi:hypothetical protein
MSKTTSQAKQMMINFLKGTRETSEFKFKLVGDDADAKKFVHRMRVELSRMRDTVKDSGRVPKEFKMRLVSIEIGVESAMGKAITKATVTLQKQEGKAEAIAEEMNDIFDDLAGGSVIA